MNLPKRIMAVGSIQALCASAAIVALVVSGCATTVPVDKASSIPDPSPEMTVDVSFIQVGETTREQVLAKIGEPPAARLQRRLFVYVAKKDGDQTKAVVSFPGASQWRGVWRYMLDDVFGTSHLFIRFDVDGVVERVDYAPASACSSEAICIAGEAVYDRGQAAVEVRQRAPHADECSVLIYRRSGGLVPAWAVFAGVDDRPMRWVPDGVFDRVDLPAGSHVVAAQCRNLKKLVRTEFSCEAGTKVYVEVRPKLPFMKFEPVPVVTLVDAESGAEDVATRGVLLEE